MLKEDQAQPGVPCEHGNENQNFKTTQESLTYYHPERPIFELQTMQQTRFQFLN